MRKRTTVGPTALLRAERSVIAGQFDGRRAAYRQFLQVAGATPAVARDAIRDQLLEAKIARGLRVAPISTADVKAFVASHAGMLTRSVETTRPVRWLVGQNRGVAVPGLAPREVLTASAGTTVLVHGAEGPVRVRILSSRVRLSAQSGARLSVRGLMLSQARAAALREWLAGAEQAAVDTALCLGDDVPVTGRSRLLARWPQLRLSCRSYSMIAWVDVDIVPDQTGRPRTSSFHG